MNILENKTQEDIDKAPVAYKEFSQAMALVATKDDLKRFATKDDFFRLERRIGNIEAKMENMATKMATKEDINLLTNTVDKVLKEYVDFKVEKPVHAHDHREIGDTLENHEKRILGLEAISAGLA